MKQEEINKTLVHQYIKEVVNTGNTSRITDFIAEEYIDHNDKSKKITGIDGAKQHIAAVRKSYPDLNVSIESLYVDGDTVITRIIATGTFGINWLEMPTKDKQVKIDGVNIDKIKNGRIVEHWGVANSLESLLSIGVLQSLRSNTNKQ